VSICTDVSVHFYKLHFFFTSDTLIKYYDGKIFLTEIHKIENVARVGNNKM
jgi:hypothetical protein